VSFNLFIFHTDTSDWRHV